MGTVGRLGSIAARHTVALVATVVVACLAWTAMYLALIVWAVVTNGGPGGPLAYPAGLLFTFVAATLAGLVLLFPSTVGGEWIARRRGWPVLLQIPASVAGLAVLCVVEVAVASAVGSQFSVGNASVGFGVLFLALLVPLGFYWWVAQSGPLLISLVRRRSHRGEA